MKKRKMFLVFEIVLFVIFLIGGLARASELDDVRRAINEKGAKWRAAETSVSQLSSDEKKKRASLLLPGLTGYEQVLQTTYQTLPATLDWTVSGFVTGVRNQGGCGSCWAFAATAGLESSVLIASNTPHVDLDLSEQVMVSCSGAGSCSGGSVTGAANFIQSTGLPLESCDPYTGTNGICGSACANWQASTYKIKSWSYVATSSPTVDGLKNALSTYGPLPTTMAVYNDFFYYGGGVYSYSTGSLAGYHAVLIVGYDDTYQCFKAKNSWGAGWGEGGFFRIAYSQLNNVVGFGDYTLAYLNGAACTYSINSTAQSFTSSGGTGNVGVIASSGCNWNAVSNASWISITSGSSGTGNGTVSYSVSADSGVSRTGTMTIAGQTYTVTQGGQNCTYTLSPTTQPFDASGGSGSVSVGTSASGCSWTAVSNAAWVIITSNSSSTGPGTVNYSVSANSGASSRTGTMTIAGQTFTVTQAGGCSYTLSPTSQSFTSSGGIGTISVTTAGAGCGWSASSSVSWITGVTADPISGKVNYTVAPNSGNSTRKGALNVANQTFTVNQSNKQSTRAK